MAKLTLDGFSGIAPIYDSRRLPEKNAQIASNVRFDGGDLSSSNDYGALSGVTVVTGTLTATGNVGRLFHTKNPAGENYLFRYYGDASIRATRNPTPGDQYWRVYHTEPSDGFIYQIPSGTPGQRKRTGVIPPSSMPIVSADNPNPEVVVSAIALTKPIVVTTAVAHNYSTGDKVKITVPTAAGTTQLNSAQFFIVNKVGDTSFELQGTDGAGYTAFVAGQGATVSRVISTSDYESRVYVYTYVNRFGEESMPSPASEVIDTIIDTGIVTVECTYVPETFYEPITAIRVYRSTTGESNSALNFVGEFIPDAGSQVPASDRYAFEDAVPALGLAEALQSTDWAPPVQNLKGLVAAPNGYMVAFKDNELHFSEPFQPHAWPESYRRAIDSRIVGIEIYGTTLVIATEGVPYIAHGSDPSSISLERLQRDATCLNPLAMVASGTGVMYPAYDGLVNVSAGGVQNITESVFTEEQWKAIYEQATCACFHDSTYYLFGTSAHYAIDLRGGRIDVRTLSLPAMSAAYFYPGSAAPIVCEAGSSNPQVLGGGAAVSGVWKSKLFEFATPVNWSCGRLTGDFTSIKDGAPAAGPVTLKLIPTNVTSPNITGADESLDEGDGYVSMTITSNDVFRLPALAASRAWTIQLEFGGAAGRINNLQLASSMSEMRGRA